MSYEKFDNISQLSRQSSIESLDDVSVLDNNFLEQNQFTESTSIKVQKDSVVVDSPAPSLSYYGPPVEQNKESTSLFTQFQRPRRALRPFSNMESLGTCRKFSGYPKDNGQKFLREFESFATLHDLDYDEGRKIAAFHLHLQGPALTWYHTLSDDITWKSLRKQFIAKYIDFGWQHPSVVIESELFQNLSLLPGQDVEDFFGQVIEKGHVLKKPDYEIMAKFIQGLPEKLAFYVRASNPEDCNAALSYAKAGEAYGYRIEQCSAVKNESGKRTSEFAEMKQQIAELGSAISKLTTNQASLNQTRQNQAPVFNQPKFDSQYTTRSEIKCFNCGKYGHIKRFCPNSGSLPSHPKCQLCQQFGHIALNCNLYCTPSLPQPPPIQCQICSKYGHTANQCALFKAKVPTTKVQENQAPPRDDGHGHSGGN